MLGTGAICVKVGSSGQPSQVREGGLEHEEKRRRTEAVREEERQGALHAPLCLAAAEVGIEDDLRANEKGRQRRGSCGRRKSRS